jgi:hypothetical protein
MRRTAAKSSRNGGTIISPRISSPAKSGSRSSSPESSSDSGTSPALLSSGLNLISISTANRRPNRTAD